MSWCLILTTVWAGLVKLLRQPAVLCGNLFCNLPPVVNPYSVNILVFLTLVYTQEVHSCDTLVTQVVVVNTMMTMILFGA